MAHLAVKVLCVTVVVPPLISIAPAGLAVKVHASMSSAPPSTVRAGMLTLP